MAHPAMGGCFHQCGSSSTIESLVYGLPSILLPMIHSQSLNAKLLVEKGLGMEVQRREDGSFSREAVAKCLRWVMVEQVGEPMRLKAASAKNQNHQPADSKWSSTVKWLDKQKPKSVVFVGFGTEYKMPSKEMRELAFALEISKLPFIWILRNPEDQEGLEFLPSGFLAQTSDKCLGSIIESLGFGHPSILLPMVLDQGLNAKLLVEKGVGLEIQRSEDGSFNRDVVAKFMRTVMVEQEGERLKLKAAQIKASFSDNESS
ncbi:hypothetical protein RJ641_013368 [Dillenia turbinata]|uniref:Uncharacterized protein n=1 Tax=Dillenia turbinata TaxID=194707 RepID=A0AAN8ZLD0_9MAGN